jgi:hypothetical protein
MPRLQFICGLLLLAGSVALMIFALVRKSDFQANVEIETAKVAVPKATSSDVLSLRF